MGRLLAFLPSLPNSRFHHLSPSFNRPTVLQCSISNNLPDAGLIEKSGVTGTTCANLWPIPVFGSYCWFLNVYDRDVAAKTGAYVIRAGPNSETLTLSFSDNEKTMASEASDTHRSFRGIVTGNINVARSLKDLGSPAHPYILKFFEAGGSEPLFQRLNEVHSQNSPSTSFDLQENEADASWQNPAPRYSVLSEYPSFEVIEMYSNPNARPQRPSRFEYFAMNLSPIFPFQKYSCFVCVWKQIEGGCPVAIDKRNGTINLSFCDPQLTSESSSPSTKSSSTGKFAVKTFFGSITDAAVAMEHKSLLADITATGTCQPLSNKDFRLLVHNKPRTLATKRQNSIWIPLL